jgi:hypothetical protein
MAIGGLSLEIKLQSLRIRGGILLTPTSRNLNTGLGHDLNGRQMEVQFPERATELAHLFSKPSEPVPGPTRTPIQWEEGSL